MISNLSEAPQGKINYPACDSSMPFAAYISQCRSMITARRPDLKENNAFSGKILDANSPFELIPSTGIQKTTRGALLIHGLLDCPFSLRDIGNQLCQSGVLCRSILLPGHGTTSADLLTVTYQEWIDAVQYGINSLSQEVDEIYLVGYSTGATLSIYHALQNQRIKGIILLSPAIRIKAPIDFIVYFRFMTRWINNHTPWVHIENEVDYAKYLSITFNAVNQVSQLTNVIHDLRKQKELKQPMLMVMSREDETVSSHRAIDYFTSLKNEKNKLLLYTSIDHLYPDKRIETRMPKIKDMKIQHLAHAAIPFSPDNTHYGLQGDYPKASTPNDEYIFGAFNRLEIKLYDNLYKSHLLKTRRKELTYNPDFDYMASNIRQFIHETNVQTT